MAFSNAFVEIRLGNVESRLVGPVPRQALDRAVNRHLYRGGREESFLTPGGRPVLVYHAGREIFLTGALPAVKRVLRRHGARYRVKDLRRSRTREPRWELRGLTLRDYQREVVDRAVEAGHGMIDIGTGGGKTLLAAAVVAELGLPTLWLVTTRTLLAQTVRNLREHLGVEAGVVGEGISRPERLTVALIQAIPEEQEFLARWRGGTIVFDEGHHAAAGSWQELIRRAAPRYHYYLSAVPFRSGRDQTVLDALAGDRLTGGRYSAEFLIERGYACPVTVRAERCRIEGEMREKPFGDLYREFIVENAERNARIAGVASRETAAGKSVLVLVDHVRQGERIRKMLRREARFVHGSTPRRRLHATTREFSEGSLRCLIATAGLFQEGVSIDGIHVLVMGGGLRSRAKVIQTVGRGMRRAPGKADCLYVDFWDDDEAGVFRRHSMDRFRALKEEGFHVPPLPRACPPPEDEAPIPPTWSHVPNTKRFVLVDGEGEVRAKATCLRREVVPDRFCKRCEDRETCQK